VPVDRYEVELSIACHGSAQTILKVSQPAARTRDEVELIAVPAGRHRSCSDARSRIDRDDRKPIRGLGEHVRDGASYSLPG
jgi:hypothetical protein